MLQNIIFIVVIILIIIIALGIIKHVFGLLVKIATFLLILIILAGAFTYLDLARNDLIGNTGVIFANENKIVGGILLSEGKIIERFNENNLSYIDYSSTKENNFEEIFFIDENELNLNISMLVFVIGNYSKSPSILENTRFESILDLIKFFKNEELYFNPKSTSTSIIEKLRN